MANTHLNGARGRTRAGKITLQKYADIYAKRRGSSSSKGESWRKSHKPIKKKTLDGHIRSLRYFIGHFGPNKPVENITPLEVEDFLEAYERGDFIHLRQWTRTGKPPGKQQVAKTIRALKAAFEWGRRNGLVSCNPLADFSGSLPSNPPDAYVTVEDAEAVAQQCRRASKAILVRLCRLAALRRSEALNLRWSEIDWERHRMSVPPTKTQRRETPICPALYDHLLARFAECEPGQEFVSGERGNNLPRSIGYAQKAAGVYWPKTFQPLRASCENDWKMAGVAEPTYLSWVGHSTVVSRGHYVTPTEREFAAITGQAPDAGHG
jgi:integrase